MLPLIFKLMVGNDDFQKLLDVGNR